MVTVQTKNDQSTPVLKKSAVHNCLVGQAESAIRSFPFECRTSEFYVFLSLRSTAQMLLGIDSDCFSLLDGYIHAYCIGEFCGPVQIGGAL